MNHKQAFGAALREHRTRKKLSQDDLGYLADLDRTYISLVELGQKSPTLDTQVKLAAALNVEVSVLILRMEQLMRSPNARPSA